MLFHNGKEIGHEEDGAFVVCCKGDAEVNQKDLSRFYPIRYWDAAHKVDCRT